MKKTCQIIAIAVFLLFIGGFFVLNIVTPDREFSPQENKYLQMLPDFSFKALFSGKFTKDFEDYTTEQFAFRDGWIAMKARCELLSGKKENNGSYYCGDTILPDFDNPGQEEIDRRADYVNALAENVDTPVYFGLIPGATEINASLLPKNAPADSQQTVLDWAYGRTRSTAGNVDVQTALAAHRDEYIFYRTDHHWTSLGAYYGYTALCESMGLTPSPLSAYDRQTVSEDFCGTTWSSSGFTWVKPDTIETFVPDDGSVTVMNLEKNPPQEGPLYVTSFLDVKDKYSMFLGGNSALRSIDTGHDGPTLLIVRDSYADSLVPFLLEHFSRIDLVDLRYYRDSLTRYINDNGFDSVLVLYSVPNFTTDQNLFLLSM